MSDNLTKEQRRKQRKKEAKKKKKLENDQGSVNETKDIGDRPSALEAESLNGNNETEEDNFESEVCWCIEQLQLGIKNKKPTKDEAEKAAKMIKLLRSDKTAKVRKRQVMRTTFGDYRKKMATEAKQKASQVGKELKITAAANEKAKESLFLKIKSDTSVMPAEGRDIEDENWHFRKSDNNFQFSFPDPE